MTGPAPRVDRGALAAFLAGRRWSGARGGELRVLGGEEGAPLLDAPPAALHVVRVAVGGGAPYELLVPLARRAAGDPDAPREGRVAEADGAVVYDATLDAEVRQRVFDAVREGRALAGGALVAAPLDGAVVPPSAASRVSAAEQSNTSLVYADAGVMLKLFRRVEAGENPDVEIGRFLARRDFPHTPRLLGTIALRRPSGDAVVGMAQQLVPGAEDAWAYAVRSASAAVAGLEASDTYAGEAARLGAVTRALHDALASDPADPDFAPEPAGRAHAARWAAAARQALADAARAAASSSAPGAALVRERQGDVAALIERAESALGDDAGAAVRHHGDYHLGQVLRTPDGALYVIDFEGEPARPLAERRARHSPLRDVAGMLRSFAYAAAFAARGGGADAADVDGSGAAHAGAWERSARSAFLAAYFTPPSGAPSSGAPSSGTPSGGARSASYLPATRAGADALLALFELEKLVYEVTYELQNRPDWADIPLGGLARALATREAEGRA